VTENVSSTVKGPLSGIKIVEMSGVGPGPFCGMLLADMGAQIIVVDRKAGHGLGIEKETRFNPTTRSRRSIAIDLKNQAGRTLLLELMADADVLIEGNRPGVMERLGLGPEDCWKVNERLVYARSTGWGQEGPLASTVGHDLNYLALSGLLSMIGPRGGAPAIPLNIIGDYAGGGLYLALGVLAAVTESRISGKGQVVDVAMIDGISSMMTHQFGFLESKRWEPQRGTNFLDGGAPWYNVYRTADGQYVSVAPIEAKFYAEFLSVLELDPASLPDQLDRDSWPQMREKFSEIFCTRTRDEWCHLFEGREACFAPVLSVGEAQEHPHMLARNAYLEVDGVTHPAPAPRFSRTPAEIRCPPQTSGGATQEILREKGYTEDEIATLRYAGAIT
jgi:alpha-methylacyl-CoA racemase